MALYDDVKVVAGNILKVKALHDAEPCTPALKPPVEDSMAPHADGPSAGLAWLPKAPLAMCSKLDEYGCNYCISAHAA